MRQSRHYRRTCKLQDSNFSCSIYFRFSFVLLLRSNYIQFWELSDSFSPYFVAVRYCVCASVIIIFESERSSHCVPGLEEWRSWKKKQNAFFCFILWVWWFPRFRTSFCSRQNYLTSPKCHQYNISFIWFLVTLALFDCLWTPLDMLLTVKVCRME